MNSRDRIRTHLRLLGVPRAEHPGGELRFPDRKCIALLAVLALDGPCTRARMASLLWDEQNDADARRNLRRELHRLREAGFDALLVTDGDLLQLREGVEVDATAFNRLQQAKTPAETSHLLAAYSGELLQGFDLAGAASFNDWLAARRDALAQRWRAAAESHCDTLQDAGDLRAALGLACELLHHDTLQEAHYRRAMSLHAALGEREAALALYERCRRQLGRELGLKPLALTVNLADQIRSGAFDAAPTARPAASSPATVPALQTLPDAPLVGRDPLLAELKLALAQHPLVVLRGEAGLGKSGVLQALAAATPGARLHAARSSDRRVPFAALARWLRSTAPQANAPAWVQAELARLLPEWGAPPPPITTDAERLRLYEAVRVVWAHSFGDAPLHLFDDWHFVDEASAQWWSWWQGQREAGPALLVAERPGQASADTAAVLADALAASGGSAHDLLPLDGAALFQLVQRLSGTERPERFAHRLWQATAGHPLYALQTLQHLLQTEVIRIDAHGQWHTPFDDATADYRELPIAPSVQAALLQRVHSLAEGPRRLIEAASLAGDDISLPLTAAACALGEWDAVQALEAALQARVLLRHDDKPGTYRFAHDLFAQTVAAALSPERRRLLHRAIGQWLAHEGAAPARVADHLEQAAHTAAERALACDWRLRALAAARQRMALGDVLLQADRVLALSPTGDAAVRAHLGRSSALLARSQGDPAAQALAAAQALLQPGTDLELQVAVLAMRAFQSLQGQGNEADLAALDGLLQDARLSGHQRGRLLKCRSDTLRILGRAAEANQALDEALTAFGDEPSFERGNMLDSRARIAMGTGDFATVLEQARLAVTVMHGAGNPGAAAAPLTMCGVALMCQGHLAQALVELQAARELAHRHALVSVERGAILNLVPTLLGLGRGADALVCLEEGYALSPSFRGPAEQQAFLEARYQCRVDLGDLGGALAVRPDLLAFSARVGEAPRRHSGQLVALDLPLLLDDLGLAAPLAEQLVAEVDTDEPHYLSVQALAKGAWLSLLQGRFALALARSRRALELPCQRPEDEALRGVMHAAALLANGQADTARQALPAGFDKAGAEVRALCLAMALQVQLGSGGVEGDLHVQVLGQLQGEPLPPLTELHLLGALAQHPQGPSPAHQDRARALAARLQASLHGHAEAHAGFVRRFGHWLEDGR